nr:MAG TPA: hypothetical protein [Caudoviricetes sp.]
MAFIRAISSSHPESVSSVSQRVTMSSLALLTFPHGLYKGYLKLSSRVCLQCITESYNVKLASVGWLSLGIFSCLSLVDGLSTFDKSLCQVKCTKAPIGGLSTSQFPLSFHVPALRTSEDKPYEKMARYKGKKSMFLRGKSNLIRE